MRSSGCVGARTGTILGGAVLLVLTGCGAGGGGGGGGGGAAEPGPGPMNGNVTADAGAVEQTALLDSGQAALTVLDASDSSSSNGQIVSYEWSDDTCGVLATEMVAEVEFGVGEHPITLVVTDETGATAETGIVVTVVDSRPSSFTVTTAVQGSGRADPAAGTPTSFDLNSIATVTATPDPGWQFVRWAGDSQETTASISLVMGSDKSLTAVFEPIDDSDVPRFLAPWAAHETRKVGQANNGQFSHQDRFAWDYTVDIGTPILAVAAGRVVRIVDHVPNNAEGEASDEEAPANMVQIDHGDGLQSLYAHLDQGGVLVLPGQLVVAGQYLGRSGNSGYSTGPHLHYEILDAAGQSTPSGYVETVDNDGVPQEDDLVTSQNAIDVSSLDDYVESTLPLDTFAENNIELDPLTPPAFFYTTGVTYTVRGRVTDRATNACVALVDLDSQETVFCESHPVSRDGGFDIDFTFPGELTGNYLLGIVSGVVGVSGVAPVTVLLSPPESGNSRPTATVQQPADNTIDFGETATLQGSGSDPDGDSLTYLWAQTSGPPATIANATSPQTTFTLAVGSGISTVRFQLTAFDGSEASLPAEVEFRMPDNLHVLDIGVTDQECSDADSCAAVSTTTVSAGRQFLSIWIDLLNAVEGDATSFEIRDPSGETVLSGRLCEPLSESFEQVFLRFPWSGNSLTPASGDWRAVYLRNGIEEASTVFTLAP